MFPAIIRVCSHEKGFADLSSRYDPTKAYECFQTFKKLKRLEQMPSM